MFIMAHKVIIKQFKNKAKKPVAGLTPEHAIYDKNGIRLDAKLGNVNLQEFRDLQHQGITAIKTQETRSIQAVADREEEILAKSNASEISYKSNLALGTNLQTALNNLENTVKDTGQRIGFKGIKKYTSDNYCGFYYLTSSQIIAPAASNINGILIPIVAGASYILLDGHECFTFTQYPIMSSKEGYKRAVSKNTTFIATEDEKYLLINVLTTSGIAKVSININGLTSTVANLEQSMHGEYYNDDIPKIPAGTRLNRFFECSGTCEITLSLAEGTTDTVWRIMASTPEHTHYKTLLINLTLGQTYKVEVPVESPGVFLFTDTNTASGAPVGDVYHVSIQAGSLDKRITNLQGEINTLQVGLNKVEDSALSLKGQTIVCFGDSITEFNYSTEGKARGWCDWFAEISGANVINVAVGGSQIRQRANPILPIPTSENLEYGYRYLDMIHMVNAACTKNFAIPEAGANFIASKRPTLTKYQDIVNRLKAIDWDKVDKVILMGGVNDWENNNGNTENKSDKYDINYTLGALNTIIKNIMTTYPKVQMFYVSPTIKYHHPNDFRTTIDYKIDDYVTYDNYYWRFTSDKIAGPWSENYAVPVSPTTDARPVRISKYFSDSYFNNNKTLKEFAEILTIEAQKQHIPVLDVYNTIGWNEYNFNNYYINSDSSHPFFGFKQLGEHIYRFVQSPIKQSGDSDNVVKVTKQEFAIQQQAQVRNNISAASKTEVEQLYNNVSELDDIIKGKETKITYPKIVPGTRLSKSIALANGSYTIQLTLDEGVTDTLYNIYASTSTSLQAKNLLKDSVLGQTYEFSLENTEEEEYIGINIMTQSNTGSGATIGDIYTVQISENGLNQKVKDLQNTTKEILTWDNKTNKYVYTSNAHLNMCVKEAYINTIKFASKDPTWGDKFYLHSVWKKHTSGGIDYYRFYLRNTLIYQAGTTKTIFIDCDSLDNISYLHNDTYGVYFIVDWNKIDGSEEGVEFIEICFDINFSPTIYALTHDSIAIENMNTNTNSDFSKLLATVGKTGMVSWVDDDGKFDGTERTGCGNIQTTVLAVANALDIPVTFGIICDEERPLSATINIIDGRTITKAEFMNELQKKGHQFTAHPYHNGWYGDHYDITKVEPYLIECLTELQKANMLHSDMLIYPGSSSTIQAVIEKVRKWCVCGVVAGYGKPNHLADNTKWQISRTFVDFEGYYDSHHNDAGFTTALDWYKSQVDAAAANGDWIIFGTHCYFFTDSENYTHIYTSSGVEKSYDYGNANTVGTLKLLMQYALDKGLEYRTLWDAYNRRKYLYDFKEINN